jgi:transcriptional regulator of arginine metabolism
MSKLSRHSVILDLLKNGPLANQETLRSALARRGVSVTQATLSRDVHRLGLVKTKQGYVLPQDAMEAPAQPAVRGVQRLFREFVRDVKEAQNLLVIRTAIGSAQPVAVAWDAESWPEVFGSVAGDDTILAVCPDAETAHEVGERIRKLMG